MKIYGNENILSLTAGMVRKGREPHSVIIYGEKGLGKKAMAKYMAAQLMCEEHTGTPCGHCKACRMIENGTHPDLIVAQSNAKGNYIVKDIREGIVSDIAVAPTESDIKVIVIPDFDLSTITAVQIQNILLKIIEEPPDHAAVILTARSKECFLPTIISRCLSFGMVNVTKQEAADCLQNAYPEADPAQIAEAVEAGGGNIGRCRDYMEKGNFFFGAQLASKLAQAYATGSEYSMLKALSGADGKKDKLRDGLYYFSEILRDASIMAAHERDKDILISCNTRLAAKLAEQLTPSSGAKVYDIITEYISRLDANCNPSLTSNSLCASLF